MAAFLQPPLQLDILRNHKTMSAVPEIAAQLGAPNPCNADIYELINTMIDNKKTVIDVTSPITLSGDGSVTNPYVIGYVAALEKEINDMSIDHTESVKYYSPDVLVSILPDGSLALANVSDDVIGAINCRHGEKKLIYLGAVHVKDDGSCVVSGRATINSLSPGTVTSSTSGWIVLKRIDANTVKIRLT